MKNSVYYILLVEDEDAHAELIRRVFEPRQDKFHLTVKKSLTEAKEYLAATTPDLVISDIKLPDGEGLELLPDENSRDKYPLIVTTAFGDEKLAVEAMKAGVLDYIVKSRKTLSDMPHIVERALREWNYLHDGEIAQKVLEESEARFRAVAETSLAGISIMDLDKNIIYANGAFVRMLGYSQEELQSMNLLDIASKEELERYREITKKDPSKERDFYELNLKHKDGHLRSVLFQSSSFGKQGMGGGVSLVVIVDITDRKEAERQILKSGELYRSTTDAIDEIIHVVDRDLRLTLVNSKVSDWLRRMDLDSEDLINKTVFEVFPFLTEEVREEYEAVFDSMQPLVTEKTYTISGRVVTLETRKIPINPEGTIPWVLTVVRDITEERLAKQKIEESKEKYRALVDGLPSNLAMGIIQDGEIVFANSQSASVAGFEDTGEMYGLKMLDLIAESEKERIADFLARRFSDNDPPPSEYETALTRADGSEVPVHLFVERTMYKGKPAIQAVFYDITERKKSEQVARFVDEFQSLIIMISSNFINLAPEEIDEGINDALEAIGRFAYVDRCYLFQFSEDGKIYENTHEWCAMGVEPQINNLKNIPADRHPWLMSRIKNLENINVVRLSDLPPEASAEKKEFHRESIRSVLAVPMIYREKAMGIVGFDLIREEREWSEETVTLLRIAGAILVSALQGKRAQMDLKQSEERYRALQENMPAGVFRSTLDGKILAVNPSLIKIMGFDSEEEYLSEIATEHYVNSEERKVFLETLINDGEIINYEVQLRGKDMVPFWASITAKAVKDHLGNVKHVDGIITNIQQKKLADEAVMESEERFRTAFLTSPDAISISTLKEGAYVDINEGFTAMTGYIRKEALGKTSLELNMWRDPEDRQKFREAVEKEGSVSNMEFEFRLKDGSFATGLLSAKIIMLKDKPHILTITRDVTNLKKAEAALVETERKTTTLMNNLPGMAYRCRDDEYWTMEFVSEGCVTLTGYEPEELVMNKDVAFIDLVHPEDRYTQRELVDEAIEGGTAFEMQYRIIAKGGETRWVWERGTGIYDRNDELAALEGFIFDITDKKAAEEALGAAEERVRTFIENADDVLYFRNLYGAYNMLNRACEKISGYTQEDFKKDSQLWGSLIHPDDEKYIDGFFEENSEGVPLHRIEYRLRDVNGDWHWIESRMVGVKDMFGRYIGYNCIDRDITEFRKTHAALIESEERYRSLQENIPVGVFRSTSEGEVLSVNPSLLEMLDYQSIDELRDGRMEYFPPVAEKKEELLERLKNDSEITDFPVQVERKDGSTFWGSLSAKAAQFDINRIVHIDGVLRDITKQREAEDLQKESETMLRNALRQIGTALSRAQELRDPYTSGHGVNVSAIAKAIAEKLGWEEDRILNLELTGLIHDVGKLGISIEILTKPGKLNKLEYEFVKEHARNGYEVLKDLPFDFPLAEAVYEHHERMDGTGYPRGLKGDEIIIEARILAVADFLDALTAHRPYRPSKPISEVLNMLREGAGSEFDEEIVDIAIGLIEENRGKFWL